MKVGEFKQMMAYITRPGFKDGTEKIVEPPKSMQMDTTTSNPIPDYDINDFKNDAEIFVLAYHNNTLPRADIADKLNSFAQKGVDAGTFTMQEAADAVKDLKLYVKDRARQQRLRDVIPEGIGTIDRENFGQGSGGGRPKVEIPGLEEKVKELFNKGLSRNEVLKELKKIPKFENATVGVVRRIKEESGVGATKKELFKSIEEKYKKLKTLIKESNNSLLYTTMKNLREEAGLPQNVAKSDLKNYEKFNIPKLDTAPEKIKKAFNKIINNPNIPVEEVFDVSSKIGKQTGTSVQLVGEVLNTIPEYEDFKPISRKLQNPAFKARVIGKEKTLADVIEMAGNIGPSSGYVSMGNTPERFILNSITRHINQGGDKVEWVKAPSETVTETEAIFKYKGKEYDYYDLLQKGRKIDDFKEVYKSFDELNDLLSRDVIDPVTKQKTSFKELMSQAYKKGAGYGDNINPYEIDHFGSVKDNPFSNLRILPRRINAAAGAITSTAQRAAKGVFTKQADKWTPAKSKMYLQKSGYNFTKDIDKLFNDEVKLANDILVKNRKLRTPVEIGKEAAEKKFKGLLNLEGVTTASQIDRPQSALDRESFKRFNEKFKPRGMSLGAAGDIPMAKEILAKDFEKLKTIFGSKAAKQIAQTSLKSAGSVIPFEALFLGDYQQQGYSPKEMALNLGTLGLGTIFKDIKEKFDYVKSKGLGDELQSAFRKQTINQQARPTLGGAEGMFKEQTLTPDEQAALNIYNLDAQNIIDMRRDYQAGEYEKTDKAFGFDDPMMRSGAMDGGIMRLNFSVGGLASLFKKAAQVSDALRKVKNATFEMFNNVRMFGDQKGIEKNLQKFTNIPDKNRKISSLEDIQTLKANVPEKYHQDLDIMMKSIEQNNFETAWKEYKKFEKDLDPSLKFENIPQEYFPMVDPLNDSFVITSPRESFKAPRYSFRTSMELDPKTKKPTGKYQREKLEIFDPETGTFREEGKVVGVTTEKGKEGLN